MSINGCHFLLLLPIFWICFTNTSDFFICKRNVITIGISHSWRQLLIFLGSRNGCTRIQIPSSMDGLAEKLTNFHITAFSILLTRFGLINRIKLEWFSFPLLFTFLKTCCFRSKPCRVSICRKKKDSTKVKI